jgi:hypothetical protein
LQAFLSMFFLAFALDVTRPAIRIVSRWQLCNLLLRLIIPYAAQGALDTICSISYTPYEPEESRKGARPMGCGTEFEGKDTYAQK